MAPGAVALGAFLASDSPSVIVQKARFAPPEGVVLEVGGVSVGVLGDLLACRVLGEDAEMDAVGGAGVLAGPVTGGPVGVCDPCGYCYAQVLACLLDQLPALVGDVVGREAPDVGVGLPGDDVAPVYGVVDDRVGALVARACLPDISMAHDLSLLLQNGGALSLNLYLRVRLGRVTETAEAPPGDAFAALMSGAAQKAAPVPPAGDPEAPYGYTRDRESGELRPKKSPGRGGVRVTPSVEELKTPQEGVQDASPGEEGAGGDPVPPPPPPADRAPSPGKPGRLRKATRPDAPVPAYKPGVITKGVNRLYRKAGKIVRAMDADIGEAIIQSARNTADDGELDDSVGAAWEELARTNPRIRRFVMKCISGGAWGQLIMAHAPIAMAIMMKPAILKHIPFAGLVQSVAEPDEDTPEGEGGLPGGMTADDAQQMADLAQQQMAKMGMSVPPEVAAQMAQMASGIVNGSGPPSPKSVRNQPRRPPSRAGRHGS